MRGAVPREWSNLCAALVPLAIESTHPSISRSSIPMETKHCRQRRGRKTTVLMVIAFLGVASIFGESVGARFDFLLTSNVAVGSHDRGKYFGERRRRGHRALSPDPHFRSKQPPISTSGRFATVHEYSCLPDAD